MARMPLQPTGSVTSLHGSLNTMRLLPVQPAYCAGAASPLSTNVRLELATSVHAASALPTALRDAASPSFASPVWSIV